MDKNCPVCAQGLLHTDSAINVVEKDGLRLEVSRIFHWCDACGTEMTLTSDARTNARVALEAMQVAKGRMSGKAIQRLRKLLKLTQEVAGKVFGGGPVAFSKYESSDMAPSDPMDNLLWLVNRYPALAADLASRVDCSVNVQFGSVNLEQTRFEINELDRKNYLNQASTNIHIVRTNAAAACIAFNAVAMNQDIDFSISQAA